MGPQALTDSFFRNRLVQEVSTCCHQSGFTAVHEYRGAFGFADLHFSV